MKIFNFLCEIAENRNFGHENSNPLVPNATFLYLLKTS